MARSCTGSQDYKYIQRLHANKMRVRSGARSAVEYELVDLESKEGTDHDRITARVSTCSSRTMSWTWPRNSVPSRMNVVSTSGYGEYYYSTTTTRAAAGGAGKRGSQGRNMRRGSFRHVLPPRNRRFLVGYAMWDSQAVWDGVAV